MTTNPPLIPYMAGLSLLDFSQLINDPLLHDHNWPYIPTKLPLDIPTFEVNPEEYPTNHVHSFSHVVFIKFHYRRLHSSSSLPMHLTGVTGKWYVD